MFIEDTEPANSDTPHDPFLSERLLITKSPEQTSFLLSPESDFAALANCGTIPSFVTDKGG